jgi:hypothetical protein
VPPEPTTGVNDVTAKELVSVFEAIDWIAESGPLITNAKVFELVAPLASVEVTV